MLNPHETSKSHLFIIYTGHNEFLEKRTYEHITELPEFVVDLAEIFASTRIYTAMKSVIDKTVFQSSNQARKKYQMTGEVDEILNHSVGPSSYTRDDLFKKDVIAHYKFNLKRMVREARSIGSEIMFITPVANLKDISPFKSQNDAGLTAAQRLRWEHFYESGLNLKKSGKYKEASRALQKARAIDSRHADLNYRLGYALFKLRRFDEAKESFQRAVDEDVCPLRILTPMRQALRTVTNKQGVPLVDFETHLERIYSRGYGHTLFGQEYFLDHVHLTYQGYRLLALDILDELERQGTVKPTPSWNDKSVTAVTKKMEQQIDSKMMAESLKNIGKVLDWAGRLRAAQNVYLKSYGIVQDNGTLIRLARNSSRMGNQAQAVKYLEKVLQIDPDDSLTHYEIAVLFEKQRRFEEASKHYKKILETEPGNAAIHYELGIALSKLQQNDEALYHLKEAVRIDPGANSLAEIFAKTGYTDEEAITVYENLLKMDPTLAGAHNHLGLLMAQKGEIEKAEQHFRKEIQRDPTSEYAQYYLASTLSVQGKLLEAVEHYKKAITLNPEFAAAYYDLGTALKQQKKFKEAEYYFSEAQRIEKTVP